MTDSSQTRLSYITEVTYGIYYSRRMYSLGRTYFEQVVGCINLLRDEAVTLEVPKQINQTYKEIYVKLIRCCLLGNDVEAAFKYSCSSKSRLVSESIADRRGNLNAALSNDGNMDGRWKEIQEKQQEADWIKASLNVTLNDFIDTAIGLISKLIELQEDVES